MARANVVVTFQHADMSTTQMVWFWDADERYVFEPDHSYSTKTACRRT